MGQRITVTTRRGGSPDVRFFDCNRSLTGMAIERYESADDPRLAADADDPSPRPPDVLVRRLSALGATRVTVYSNVVTVEAPADRWAGLEPEVVTTIEHLFHYYGDDAGWSPEALAR
jgi:hypothetical protein